MAPDPSAHLPLDTGALAAQLGEPLALVLSPARALDDICQALSGHPRHQQDFVLHWVGVIARTNAELGYQFLLQSTGALARIGTDELEDWIISAMDTYDRFGLYAANDVFARLDDYLQHRQRHTRSLPLARIQPVLEFFARGLSGRPLRIDTCDTQAWTDTETLYLPIRVARFRDEADNFTCYKLTAALLWAMTRFGSFALDAKQTPLIAQIKGYDDPDLAQAILLFLETIRLRARLAHELPGLARAWDALEATAGTPALPEPWQAMAAVLGQRNTTVKETLDCLKQGYPAQPPEALLPIELHLPRTSDTIQARLVREREALQQQLAELIPTTPPASPQTMVESSDSPQQGFSVNATTASTNGIQGMDLELTHDGQPVELSDEMRALLQSILQDLGAIPPEYLSAAGDGHYNEHSRHDIEVSEEAEAGGEPYPEWDCRRGHYRKDWCQVRELEIEPGAPEFVDDTLRKYAAVLPRLRKSFEALRGEDKWLRRQSVGDDIDFDALVESLADMVHGRELSDKLFKRLSRIERDIAVMFMIDMSGSTKGWVNDAEREALVLLCQALEILGDRYAIYGFSGMTRNRCELYRIKTFGESYGPAVEQRIAGIRARDYTRMGASIRHLNRLLSEVPARTKLMITLSDGKPDDFDGYRGEYGIEDTRQALIESRHLGIHPFCLTIDTEARGYLPHMYGARGYAVVDDVRQLPLKLADVYRRLTH